jgi:hypothetical protein
MPMLYKHPAIPDSKIPRAAFGIFQHILDTYASEINKTVAIWQEFTPDEMLFKPHVRSSTVQEIMKHQLLSERRFCGEFLGFPELPAAQVLPEGEKPPDYSRRLHELAWPRLNHLAIKDMQWWVAKVPFFDVERERIWIFWRRILHTAHHRTQLAVYLRLLNKPVPATYGPTADATWVGADPTTTIDAAQRA